MRQGNGGVQLLEDLFRTYMPLSFLGEIQVHFKECQGSHYVALEGTYQLRQSATGVTV